MIAAASWNALVGDHPLLSHAFLHALHETGCASPRSGWAPRYYIAVARRRSWSGRCRSTRRRTPTANTSSTGPGPTPTGATAAATTRSCCRRSRSRRRPGPRLLAADAAHAPRLLEAALGLWRRARSVVAARAVPADEDEALELRSARACCCATACSSTGATRLPRLRRLPVDLRPTTSARRSSRSGGSVREAGVELPGWSGTRDQHGGLGFLLPCYAHTYREHHSTPYLTLRVLRADRRDDAAKCAAGDRRSRTASQFAPRSTSTRRDTLWGRYWGATRVRPGPALRGLLLPGDRILHRARHRPFEGGAQGVHKLARGLLPVTTQFGACDRRSRISPRRSRAFARASASMSRRRSTSSSGASPFRQADCRQPLAGDRADGRCMRRLDQRLPGRSLNDRRLDTAPRDGAIATLTLNRPASLNALDLDDDRRAGRAYATALAADDECALRDHQWRGQAFHGRRRHPHVRLASWRRRRRSAKRTSAASSPACTPRSSRFTACRIRSSPACMARSRASACRSCARATSRSPPTTPISRRRIDTSA